MVNGSCTPNSLPRWKRMSLVATAVALLCTGCAFRRQVAGMAIEHNDFVAQTTNRQTVLNILRASQREPMHFTSFTAVSGKAQGTGQLGLTIGGLSLRGAGGTVAETDTTVTKTGPGGLIDTTVTDSIVDTATRGTAGLSASPQVSVTTGTDFTMAVNATDDFYRGIIGQLSEGIIVHYLRQGFPSDLLTHLLVRRLEFRARIVGPGGFEQEIPLGIFENAPDESGRVARFAEAVKCWNLSFAARPVAERRVPAPDITTLAGINPDVLARLRPRRVGSGYDLLMAPEHTDFDLAMAPTDQRICGNRDSVPSEFQARVASWVADNRPAAVRPAPPDGASTEGRELRDSATRRFAPMNLAIARPSESETLDGPRAIAEDVGGRSLTTLRTDGEYFRQVLADGYKGELIIDITLRSVEGILYYLGEYVRNPNSPLLEDEACPDDHPYCLPIIRIRPAGQIPAAQRFVDVRYRGTTYAVPIAGNDLQSGGGRSSQVVSLVQQLLNLHRSSRELPGTTLVRVTN